jgi:hypothetical protein
MQCAECSAKPGAYSLCPACLHNRTTIEELVGRVQSLEEERGATREMYESVHGKRHKDYGWLILFLLIAFSLIFGTVVFLVKGG